jgi:acyl-CoA thioesterase
MTSERLAAQTVAEASARAMWERDVTCRDLGVSVDEMGPGRAVLAMTIAAEMANFHGTCHGGYIFLLADSALSYACNSYNHRSVAHVCSITYLHPAKIGERLVARAEERARSGRTAIYDVSVHTDEGVVVAEFRGQSRTIDGKLLPELGPPKR